MAGNLDLVLESENPDYIVRGWTGELIAVGLVMFLAGFVFALYRLLAGGGCVDLPVVAGGER